MTIRSRGRTRVFSGVFAFVAPWATSVLLLAGGGAWIGCGGSGADQKDGGGDASVDAGEFVPFGDGGGAFVACATDRKKAALVPLDVVVMLDTSLSMTEKTPSGATKWSAITSAIGKFVEADESQGLGFALNYFPYTAPSVPKSCTASSQCGDYGPCGTLGCAGPATDAFVQPCQSQADCSGGAACSTIGTCSANLAFLCTNVGGSCGGSLGTCQASTGSTCAEEFSCKKGDYQSFPVSLGVLPGNANSVATSLAARTPNGDTPTSAALEGALAYADGIARDNPTHKVVVVLATDGLPSRCFPTSGDGIGAIAAKARALPSKVSTFVVGVLTQGDTQGPPILDAIAKGGGTDHAYVISTAGDLAASFRETLDVIRGATAPCDFALPTPEAGTPDYSLVNVVYTTGEGHESLVRNATSVEACASGFAWYYDTPPSAGAPSRVVLCPDTCKAVRKDRASTLDVVLGCKTEFVPK
ncbi:MAG: vWA domain-containing protein [Polyangiaceae bacterium]